MSLVLIADLFDVHPSPKQLSEFFFVVVELYRKVGERDVAELDRVHTVANFKRLKGPLLNDEDQYVYLMTNFCNQPKMMIKKMGLE